MSDYSASDPKNLIVNYIPTPVTDEELRQMFAQFGDVESARVIVDREMNNHPKGYGFVKFRTAEAAASAIQNMNGFEILGKRLKVTPAKGHQSAQINQYHSRVQRMMTQPPAPPPPPPPALTTSQPHHPLSANQSPTSSFTIRQTQQQPQPQQQRASPQLVAAPTMQQAAMAPQYPQVDPSTGMATIQVPIHQYLSWQQQIAMQQQNTTAQQVAAAVGQQAIFVPMQVMPQGAMLQQQMILGAAGGISSFQPTFQLRTAQDPLMSSSFQLTPTQSFDQGLP